MLLKPVITEKSLQLAKKGSYVFNVTVSDTKTFIKKLVEKTFGVNVVKVSTMKIAGKTKRRGKRGLRVKTATLKKAVVRVKSGQKIDLYEAQ